MWAIQKMSGKSLELEPDNDSFLDTYGWILYKRGEFADAKKYIEKAIEKGSDKSPVVIEHYGDVLFQLGDHENALILLEKAVPCIDKAAAKGVIHKATASRKISRLAKLVNTMNKA